MTFLGLGTRIGRADVLGLGTRPCINDQNGVTRRRVKAKTSRFNSNIRTPPEHITDVIQ